MVSSVGIVWKFDKIRVQIVLWKKKSKSILKSGVSSNYSSIRKIKLRTGAQNSVTVETFNTLSTNNKRALLIWRRRSPFVIDFVVLLHYYPLLCTIIHSYFSRNRPPIFGNSPDRSFGSPNTQSLRK